MNKIKVQELYIYPVKGLGGSKVSQMYVDKRGPRFDRQWMLVDEKGVFQTQRTLPQLSQLSAKVEDEARIEIQAPKDFMDFGVDEINEPNTIEVEVWKSKCEAQEVDKEVSEWVSDIVGAKLRLVRMKDDFVRNVSEKYGAGQVAFADGFPFMVLSSQSLELLNENVGRALSVKRFRPNIVVNVLQAHEEDTWSHMEIGPVRLRGARLCTRCKVVTVDPLKGDFSADNEPLATLSSYRKVESGIVFGKNFIHETFGEIKTGMEVKVEVEETFIEEEETEYYESEV